ncbi:hypothetical protein CYMTET_49282 [Cymbomonas tetramitiformis]|uniref:NADH:ubiquinone oxidoreductase 30kDa subunit domain-containing protein n=1 Tax=Cymbomonas tetramitiformis TaxID=36881 RepID=A0AAE0BQL3_9CHLO|nr:hypothetical protein CYMTET_49282 [Cymbomonas tetramitiformis]
MTLLGYRMVMKVAKIQHISCTRVSSSAPTLPRRAVQPRRVTQAGLYRSRATFQQTRRSSQAVSRSRLNVTAEDAGEEASIVPTGGVSKYLAKRGLTHKCLGFDHSGVEIVQVRAEDLLAVSAALYADGFNYLRNQCGYDSEPGGDLVSVYHLTQINPEMDENDSNPPEVCVKVFLPRANPTVPSVWGIWATADWQERETYDLYGIIYEGHPHLFRILLPENWEGYPLRKDYVTPDFYELQDAY